MKRNIWKLVCGGAVAEHMEAYRIDALHSAQQLSKWAPLLKVQLYEISQIGAVLDSTWVKGEKVKP